MWKWNRLVRVCANSGIGAYITVGYLTNRSNPASFVPIQSIQLPAWSAQTYNIIIPPLSRAFSIFPAIRFEPSEEYHTAIIDDFSITKLSVFPLPFAESFETEVFPAEGWSLVQVDYGTQTDDDPVWLAVDEGEDGCLPYDGDLMAELCTGSDGNSSRLTSPWLDFSSPSTQPFQFAMYHHAMGRRVPYPNEGIQVQVSTDGILWHNVGTILLNWDRLAEESYWEMHEIDLSSFQGTPRLRIGLLGKTMGAAPIYVDAFQAGAETSLAIPQNVKISNSGDSITLTWDPVPGAASYVVYSSSEINGSFEVDETGSYTDNTWSTTASESSRFYHVRASSAAARRR